MSLLKKWVDYVNLISTFFLYSLASCISGTFRGIGIVHEKCSVRKICGIWVQDKIPHTILFLYLMRFRAIFYFILFIITKVWMIKSPCFTLLKKYKQQKNKPKNWLYVRNKPGIGEETLKCGSQSHNFGPWWTPLVTHP